MHLFARAITFTLLLCSTSILGAQTYSDWLLEGDPNSWITLRTTNAAKGEAELIKIPLVVRSTGWGCLCPDYFIGSSPFVQDGPWIHPIGKTLPTPNVDGYVFVVTGKFTGNIIPIDLRNQDGEPDEWLYHVPEFRIKKIRKLKSNQEIPSPKIIR
jgi:hypothetical protein